MVYLNQPSALPGWVGEEKEESGSLRSHQGCGTGVNSQEVVPSVC